MDIRVPQGDQFNLKWSNHTKNFVDLFAHYQNQEELVDVTLSCEGQYVKAHRLILSACSDYFQSIFQVHKTVQHPFILLNGIKFRDLRYILNFMYHGEVKVLESDLASVLALGASLQIKGLSAVKLRNYEEGSVSENTVYPGVMKSSSPVPVVHPGPVMHQDFGDSKRGFYNGTGFSLPPQQSTFPGSNFENNPKQPPASPQEVKFTRSQYVNLSPKPAHQQESKYIPNHFENTSKPEPTRDAFKVKLPNFIVPNNKALGGHSTKELMRGSEKQDSETVTPLLKQNNTSSDIVDPPFKKRLVLSAQGQFEVSSPKTKSEGSRPNTPPTNIQTMKENRKSNSTSNNNNSNENSSSSSPRNKIPRPPNAFMIFANEWRKKLAVDHPDDNNKEISKRLGNLWKTLTPEEKEKYYEAASKADREHRLKYPNYHYNPNEARKRKSTTEKSHDRTSTGSPSKLDTLDDVDPLSVVEVEEDPVVFCLSESE